MNRCASQGPLQRTRYSDQRDGRTCPQLDMPYKGIDTSRVRRLQRDFFDDIPDNDIENR
jgi:hypothetical protein